MSEKLALKKSLYDELNKTQKELDELGNIVYSGNVFDYTESQNDLVKKKCLLQHREFILKLITICVDRNKF